MVENTLTLNEKREFIKNMINNDRVCEIPTRNPCTIDFINKANRKTIHNLYAKITGDYINKPKISKDVLSQMTETKDFSKMVIEMQSNPLISKGPVIEIPKIQNPSDIIGSYIYEKFHSILKPLALFSTFFTNMDWQRFAAISEERQKFTMSSPNQKDFVFPQELISTPLEQKLDGGHLEDNITPFDLDSQ